MSISIFALPLRDYYQVFKSLYYLKPWRSGSIISIFDIEKNYSTEQLAYERIILIINYEIF